MLSKQFIQDRKFYVICTTPRSGSNLLCDLLWSSGVMGKPQEYLNPDACILPFAQKYNLFEGESRLCFETYLQCAINNFSSANNVFGMKFLFDQFEPMMELESLQQLMPHCQFIWLVRRDTIAQAVSMYIAKCTNDWNSHQEDKNKRASVEYNEQKIGFFVEYLIALNIKWLEFFSINKLNYLTLYYEDILIDPNWGCHQICKLCQVEYPGSFSLKKATLQKQGDLMNERFSEKFRINSSFNLTKKCTNVNIKLREIDIF
jgi:trehalose 2-sulfotransferase